MHDKPKKSDRRKDITQEYLDGNLDDHRLDAQEKFGNRSKNQQKNKTARTAQMRADQEQHTLDFDKLPMGEVTQVFSLFSEVICEGKIYLCSVRKTMARVNSTQIIVGDFVRFTPIISMDATDRLQEGVVERIEERKTVLSRADSFKQIEHHPIVANAQQMLIVASLHDPEVKWGLIDRMVIAAQAGGLQAIICLNKIDMATPEDLIKARAILDYYRSLGHRTLETSAQAGIGIDELRQILQGKITVLAGHSGVGKSSLVRSIQPKLDIRVGAISNYHHKGTHTTTSARKYPLDIGGAVIDTPGVKLFGLWNVTNDNLDTFFPDIESAPNWRKDSYERIKSSIGRKHRDE